MFNIGKLMALFGAVSIGLQFINYELKLLQWIDMWGPNIGWGIRIGLVVVGCVLMGLGMSGNDGEDQA